MSTVCAVLVGLAVFAAVLWHVVLPVEDAMPRTMGVMAALFLGVAAGTMWFGVLPLIVLIAGAYLLQHILPHG